MRNSRIDEQALQIIQRRGISKVAKALGISSTVLSRYIKGTYSGDVERVERLLRDYVRRELEKQQLRRYEVAFIETQVARRIWELLRTCHLSGEFGVVVGAAGVGKTWALRRYREENSDAIMIEVVPGMSVWRLFVRLAEQVGVDAGKSATDAFENIVERLRESGRLLIVDEAEHLDYRSLELLRRLWDFTQIGVVLCGMPRLLANLRGRRQEFAQMHSRVGFVLNIDRVDRSDLEQAFPAAVAKAAQGSIRKAVKIMQQVYRLAALNDADIEDEKIIRAAVKLIEV